MKKTISVALLASVVIAPAFAADQGFYAAADLGLIKFAGTGIGGGSIGPGLPVTSTGFTLGGGYHFSQTIGVEAGYSIIGDLTITPYTIKTKIFQASAVGTYSVSHKFDLFGKLGLANEKFETTVTDTGYSNSTSKSKTNLMFGIGGQYNIGEHFSIRVQYQDFGKVAADNCTGFGCTLSAEFYSVGTVYNF